ncbi:MAG: hypothetical protein MZV64_15880 [Ignavibacteriales bacterium]|nr:hypothetical protein [Ignavibacteriales bacterium]
MLVRGSISFWPEPSRWSIRWPCPPGRPRQRPRSSAAVVVQQDDVVGFPVGQPAASGAGAAAR